MRRGAVKVTDQSKSNVYTTNRSAFLVMRKCDTESEQMSGCVLGGLQVSVCDLFRILIFLFAMHNFFLVVRIFFGSAHPRSPVRFPLMDQ